MMGLEVLGGRRRGARQGIGLGVRRREGEADLRSLRGIGARLTSNPIVTCPQCSLVHRLCLGCQRSLCLMEAGGFHGDRQKPDDLLIEYMCEQR